MSPKSSPKPIGIRVQGLRELPAKLSTANISFFMLKGDPVATLPDLVAKSGAGLLVTDYTPLRLGRKWRDEVWASSVLQFPSNFVIFEQSFFTLKERRDKGQRWTYIEPVVLCFNQLVDNCI